MVGHVIRYAIVWNDFQGEHPLISLEINRFHTLDYGVPIMTLSSGKCRASWKYCTVITILLLLAGCSGSKGQSKGEEGLISAVEGFNSTLRWEDYRLASAWIPQNDKELFWGIADLFQGRLRIMDSQIREISIAPGGTSGNVVISFRFYFTSNPTLVTRTIHQKWVFSEERKSWLVTRHDLEGLLEEKKPVTRNENG
jgi:hypothetical protein